MLRALPLLLIVPLSLLGMMITTDESYELSERKLKEIERKAQENHQQDQTTAKQEQSTQDQESRAEVDLKIKLDGSIYLQIGSGVSFVTTSLINASGSRDHNMQNIPVAIALGYQENHQRWVVGYEQIALLGNFTNPYQNISLAGLYAESFWQAGVIVGYNTLAKSDQSMSGVSLEPTVGLFTRLSQLELGVDYGYRYTLWDYPTEGIVYRTSEHIISGAVRLHF
jgi:hypothetical protein